MNKNNQKKIACLFLAVIIGNSVCACTEPEESGINLEKTVFLGLLEEIEALDIPSETKKEISAIADKALSEDASVIDILNATSELNSIKNDFLDEPLVFIDSALRVKVCKALGKSENSVITIKDVLNVRELDLSYSAKDAETNEAKIHYISDLRKFPMLKKLDLDGNELYTLDGIENLPSLTELSISGCFTSDSASDISPLTAIKSLEVLDISKNNIESIAGLSELRKLYSLDVSETKASDIFVIAGFTSLKELGICGLTVNGEILSALTQLTSLDISNTVFTSTPNLNKLENLETLIANNLSFDITSSVSEMRKLKQLSMSDCRLTSANFISELSSLQYLNLSKNSISDPSPIYGKSRLTRLDISNNDLSSFTTSTLPELLTLNASGNNISTISLNGSKNSLVRLNVSDNQLVSVKSDQTLGLTELNISNNPISDYSFFTYLPEIKKINADNTKFTSINLTKCQKLTSLSLRNVPLENTNGLIGLINLQILDLYGSSIADISAFSQMSELKTLTATLKNVQDYSPLSGLTSIESITVYRMNNADWDSFNSMKTLKKVYIENSFMKEPMIKELPELTELTIIDCPYMSSTSRISDLPNLKTMTIIGADIPSPSVRELPELETLIMTGCDIEYPEKIAELPKLKFLDLSENDLEALVFSELNSLEYLNVSSCRVVTIKDLNAEMSYGTLILSNNYISDISILDDVYKSLKKLDVSNNRIKNFSALDAIEIGIVVADNNKVEYIPEPKGE